jgi:hypothetical protein
VVQSRRWVIEPSHDERERFPVTLSKGGATRWNQLDIAGDGSERRVASSSSAESHILTKRRIGPT